MQQHRKQRGAHSDVAAILSEAGRPNISVAIERLRPEGSSEQDDRLDVAGLSRLVEALVALTSVDVIADNEGISRAAVLDEIGELGTWLSQSKGKGHLIFTDKVQAGQMALFESPSFEEGAEINLPVSYLPRSNNGRDIRPAINAVLTHRPTREDLERYCLRNAHAGASQTLTFEAVTTTALFARLDRLDDIGDVNSKDETFRSIVCQAYDLLEVGRRDAIRGLQHMLGVSGSYDLTDDVAHMYAKTLFRAEATEIQRALGTGNEALVAKTRARLRDRVARHSDMFAISSVADLSVAQVIAIAQEHGLSSEVDSTVDSQAREILRNLGLEQDRHQHMPDAVNAVINGTTAEYIKGMRQEMAAL